MSVIGRAGDTMPTIETPYCRDCGNIHGSMIEVMRCDERLGLPTPGVSDEERAELIEAAAVGEML